MNRHPRTYTPQLFHKNKNKNLNMLKSKGILQKEMPKLRENKYLTLYDYKKYVCYFQYSIVFYSDCSLKSYEHLVINII